MIITLEFLTKHNACTEGVKYVTNKQLIGLHHSLFINKLLEFNHYDYANWLIVELLDKSGCIKYAINAAELVLHIFENKYPDDDHPRKAIEAAKNYLNSPTAENKAAANAAAAAAANAARAAYAAYANAANAAAAARAANAADDAAYAAANAAAAARAANAADDAAYAAANAAAAATNAARAAYAAANAADDAAYAAVAIKKQIIKFGIKLIGENDEREN